MSSTPRLQINHKPVVAWALNAKLSKPGLCAQLAAFKECGFGGVLVIPWGGLPYAFMSEPWLGAVECILRFSRKNRMEVWIWDDWIFPSGFAGGIVGREDEDKSRKLEVTMDIILEKGEAFEFALPPRSIVAGVSRTDKTTNLTGAVTRLRPGGDGIIRHRALERSRLVVVGWKHVSGMRHTVESHSRYLTGKGNWDIYTGEAETAFSVDMLNAGTTRKFLDCIHERYWKRFRAYFGGTLKGFFYDEPHIPSVFPWTPALESEFRSRKGYPLADHLIPMLVEQTFCGYDMAGGPRSGRAMQALEDYHDVWTDMMAENFYGAIQRWCHDHGVLSIGHMGSDESLKNILSNCGTYFKNMERSDMPGIDVIFDQLPLGKFVDFNRMAGSRASVLGKKWALSESFAAMGHGVSLDEMRYVYEHQIVRGVNKFMPKLANYDPFKSFYFHPPELSPLCSPIIRKYGAILNSRTEKLCAFMSRGQPMDRAAVYVPFANYYRSQTEVAGEIDAFAELLAYDQREFDYIGPHDLRRMKASRGIAVSAGGRRYSDVIIPPRACLHADEIRHLRSLQAGGCNVIHGTPFHELVRNARLKTCGREDLLAHLRPVARALLLSPSRLPISSSTRILDRHSSATMLLNESDKEQVAALKCPEGWRLHELEIESGKVFKLTPGVSLSWAPGQSRVILHGRREIRSAVAPPRPRSSEAILLDHWRLKLPNGKTVSLPPPFPSWNDLGFAAYSGVMTYQAEFVLGAGLDHACLDLGVVSYAATVLLDGKIAGHAVFNPYTLHLQRLTPGRHCLEIEVMNTPANAVCGTPERSRQLEREGAFRGTYAPIYLPLDRTKLRSGLFGPVTLVPV